MNKLVNVFTFPSFQRTEDIRNIGQLTDVLARFARGISISEIREAELHRDGSNGFERMGSARVVLSGTIPYGARRLCLEYVRWKIDEHATLRMEEQGPGHSAAILPRPDDALYGQTVPYPHPDFDSVFLRV
jgi:hypothetical protein